MNAVLEEILSSRRVSDGKQTLPLESEVNTKQGILLERVVERIRPTTSLEVGLAYGVSTLYICQALAKVGQAARHIAIDPYQSTQWRGIGMRNAERAGYASFVELREQKSELALPQLLADETVLDMALIDGWHTFDHALVDFFFINKMLRVGGVVILDDVSYPAIAKLVDHILTYGSYRIFELPPSPTRWISARRFLAVRRLAYLLRIKQSKWPRAVALQKISPDTRVHNWFKPF